jgi:predicted GNAT superfamily acetyltransferase
MPLTAHFAPDLSGQPQAPADSIICRRVETLAEYHQCVALEEAIWGVGFRELVPSAILMVAQKVGGVCAGAFDQDGRLLGFVFGMTGLRHGELVHWSDMLAVRPEARGAQVGKRLKELQRALCLEIGVRTMYWTFDPIVARNAHLNLVRLGARAAEYVENLYGSDTGSPLHGALETDRWIAAWDLTQPVAPVVLPSPPEAPFVVRPSSDGAMPEGEAFPAKAFVRVAIPVDHEQLTHGQRVAWRHATRRALQHYLALGYRVTHFQRASDEAPPFYTLGAP